MPPTAGQNINVRLSSLLTTALTRAVSGGWRPDAAASSSRLCRSQIAALLILDCSRPLAPGQRHGMSTTRGLRSFRLVLPDMAHRAVEDRQEQVIDRRVCRFAQRLQPCGGKVVNAKFRLLLGPGEYRPNADVGRFQRLLAEPHVAHALRQ